MEEERYFDDYDYEQPKDPINSKFEKCKTIEDASKTLVNAIIKERNRFNEFCHAFLNNAYRYDGYHRNRKGEIYKSFDPKWCSFTAEKFVELLYAIKENEIHSHLEVIGSWLWMEDVDDDEIDKIFHLGFHYSETKNAWYHTGIKESSRGIKGKYDDVDSLRMLWNTACVV